MLKNIYQINEQSLMCDFGSKINKNINLEVISLFNNLRDMTFKNRSLGLTNCVPSYNKLLINYDNSIIDKKKIIKIINSFKEKIRLKKNRIKKVSIPICYDEEFSIDLKKISKEKKIDIKKIIKYHLSLEFYVYMIGFMPGFPFMGDLHNDYKTLRLTTPRIKVPKGSVAINDKFCAIYPNESPGGWNIIGRTPINLFNKKNINPTLIKPGYNVKFYQISKNEFLKKYK